MSGAILLSRSEAFSGLAVACVQDGNDVSCPHVVEKEGGRSMWNVTIRGVVSVLMASPKRRAWLMAMAVILAPLVEASASNYRVVETHTTNYDLPLGKLQLTEAVVQDGPLSINR